MGEINQPSGAEVCRIVRKETGGKTMLAFSGGKDSVAAYLAIRDKFDEVIPIHFYRIPGLEFVEENLAYYEKHLFGGRHIIRLPHPALYRWLNNLVYVPPHHAPVIDAANLEIYQYTDLHDLVRMQYGLPDAFCATGVRAADSPMRRISIMQHSPILRASRQYFPVWDWKRADLLAAFKKEGIKLSTDYHAFGRSFDGIDARFMIPLRDTFPRDFAKVLEWFPFVEADIFRHERMQK